LPTNSPTDASTDSPTNSPTDNPTKNPTKKPTDSPTLALDLLTGEAVVDPTGAPVVDPTANPTDGSCACETDTEDDKQTWKCGNDVYVCPDVKTICTVQGTGNSIYYLITQEQCNAMKPIALGEKCIELPRYGLTEPKGLSDRVCYSRSEHGMKEDGTCETCKDSAVYELAPVLETT
jgi:hypothetical protein